MTDLIADIEAATGPSRELDARIACALDGRTFYAIEGARRVIFGVEGVGSPVWRSLSDVPAYTASIDAALTLVPEGWKWTLKQSDHRRGFYADLWKDGITVIGDAATPALALSAAALKAQG